jgi:hypothetical protein
MTTATLTDIVIVTAVGVVITLVFLHRAQEDD